MTKKVITMDGHKIIAKKFSEISNSLVYLTVKISNEGGKTKTRKYVNELDKAQKMINVIRFELEKDMLREHDEGHLYTEKQWYMKQ